MKARLAASLEMQRPDAPGSIIGADGDARYRKPETLIGRWVCCHCKRVLTIHVFTAPDGHRLETQHCPEHGDVVAMKSHIVNREFAL